MPKQQLNIKGSIVDINNKFNEVFPSFSSFNCEFSPGNRLIDIFPKHFLFYSLNKKYKSSIKSYLYKLKEITFQALSDLLTVIIILDASIKKHTTTLIAHVHIYSSLVVKTIHHVVNIIPTEAELFAIRCGVNQAIYLPNIKIIVIISDSIYTAKRIFDSSSHLYQIYSTAISYKLRKFFKINIDNSIEFWDCPSHCNWSLHLIINKETKSFNSISILLCKFSWDFSRKNKYDNILNAWKIY